MPAAWGRRQGRADEDKSIATKLTVLFDSGGEEAENAVDGGGGSSSGSNGDSLWCADSRSGIGRNEWERGRRWRSKWKVIGGGIGRRRTVAIGFGR